jgi:hypothetical protein
MRGRGIARFFVHTVTVETRKGKNSKGDVFASPAVVDGLLVDDSVKLVRDANGQEIVSNTQIAGPLTIVPLFTPGSKVTTSTRTARVIGVNSADVPGLPEHVVVTLT